MIFAVQHFLEDHFARRGLSDPDQYAVRLANLFDSRRTSVSANAFLGSMGRVKTAFFRANPGLDRRSFEAKLLRTLDGKFKKKSHALAEQFPGGVNAEARRLSQQRLSIRGVLESYRDATEARAIDPFWVSRDSNKLQRRPEAIGQGQLALFLKGALGNKRIGPLREVGSGTGWIDVVVVLGAVPHLVELKMLTSAFKGSTQLAVYMKQENRHEGWLVVFDARRAPTSLPPSTIETAVGVVRVLRVNINPVPPSKTK